MEVYVLFGQRKCRYPGQYAIEALSCMDENGQSDNPDYLQSEFKKYSDSGEFDRLAIIPLSAPEADIRSALYPEQKAIPAKVGEPLQLEDTEPPQNIRDMIPKGYSVTRGHDDSWRWESILSPESHSHAGFTSEEAAIAHCRLSNCLPDPDF